MRRLSIALLCLLIPQIAPQAQQSITGGGASVEGVVMRVGTGETLSDARVTLTRVAASTSSGATSPVLSGAIGGVPPDASLVSVSSSTPSSSSSVTTDADGRFFFQNLDEGLYSLQVLRDGYARQSYGQRIAGGPATAIRLVARQSLKSIAVALVSAGNVAGVIRGAYRTLTGNSGAFSAGERYNPKTGEFELRNVPPGSYLVQALGLEAASSTDGADGEALVRISALATRPNARVPVEVSSADVDGVLLSLTAGVAVPGRITVEGMPLSSIAGWERIRVQLKPTLDSAFGPNVQPAAPIPQAPRADGGFTIGGVSPGEFLVGPITGLPPGFYIREARFGQADVLNRPLRFTGVAGTGLEIVLSSRASQLDGTVMDARSSPAAGARLVLVPDLQRNRTDLYRTALSDSNGRFAFRGIPPGDYRVFGWEALESYAYFDQDLLRRVESQSVSVRISESAPSNVTVRMIPANP